LFGRFSGERNHVAICAAWLIFDVSQKMRALLPRSQVSIRDGLLCWRPIVFHESEVRLVDISEVKRAKRSFAPWRNLPVLAGILILALAGLFAGPESRLYLSGVGFLLMFSRSWFASGTTGISVRVGTSSVSVWMCEPAAEIEQFVALLLIEIESAKNEAANKSPEPTPRLGVVRSLFRRAKSSGNSRGVAHL
jgi:hypothetical protein